MQLEFVDPKDSNHDIRIPPGLLLISKEENVTLNRPSLIESLVESLRIFLYRNVIECFEIEEQG